MALTKRRSAVGRLVRLLNPGTDVELTSGTVKSFLLQMVGAGFSLLLQLLLVRLLGPAKFGEYALALSWINVLAVFAIFGLDMLSLRLIPQYLRQEEWGLGTGFIIGAALFVLTLSVALSIIFCVVVFTISPPLAPSLRLALLAGSFIQPIITALMLASSLQRALKRVIANAAFDRLLRPFLVAALAGILALAAHRELTAYSVLWLYGAATLVALGACVHSLMGAWRRATVPALPRFYLRHWLFLSLPFLMMSLIGIGLSRVNVLLLGGLVASSRVGGYYLAVHIASLGAFGLNAVNTLLAPMIAESYAAGEYDRLKALVRQATNISSAFSVLFTIPVAAAGPWLLSVFGPSYRDAYLALLIMLAAQLFNAACGPVGNIMTMTRYGMEAQFIMGAGAILNIALCLALIPYMGTTGAAVATAAGLITWNVLAVWTVRHRLGINPTIFSRR